MKSKPLSGKDWNFVHNLASAAQWTPGLREIFEYRDLGVKEGTKGDYVAHLIRHNGKANRSMPFVTRFQDSLESEIRTDESVLVVLNASTYYSIPFHLQHVRVVSP